MRNGPARLLLVHRYYHPDAPPYATMLRVIAERLAADGHDVHVVSSMPTYNNTTVGLRAPAHEVHEGVHVHRLRLPPERKDQPVGRALLAGLFVLGVVVEVLRQRPDLVTFSTMPPVVLGVGVRAALTLVGRRGCYLYHCQDLYPEVTMVGRDEPTLVARLVARVEHNTRRNAAAVVVLSEEMRRTVIAGGARPERTHVVNNFSLVEATAPRPEHGDRIPRVVFAGNLGRFQQLDQVATAIERVRDHGARIEWLLLGDGPARSLLEPLAGDDVELRGYVPPPVAFATLQRCDVGLVTLQPGMLDVAYPSKTMTYLAAGCQLLATAPADSDLGRTVVDNRVGRTVPAGDAEALADAVIELASDANDRIAAHCERVAEELFGRDAVTAQWSNLVADLVAAR